MSVLCEYHLHVQLGPATGCVSLTRQRGAVLGDGFCYTGRCCATDRHVATVTLFEDDEAEELDGAGWMMSRRRYWGWGGERLVEEGGGRRAQWRRGTEGEL